MPDPNSTENLVNPANPAASLPTNPPPFNGPPIVPPPPSPEPITQSGVGMVYNHPEAAYPNYRVTPVDPAAGKKKVVIYLSIFLVVLGLLSASVFGVAYAIAYEKININNPQLQKNVARAVMMIPFMPKTVGFILESSSAAHKKQSSHSFDISVAVKSNDLSSNLGLNQLDAKLTGDVNYQNPKNLKVKLKADITKDFSFELYKPDTRLFFKIDQVPSLILTAFGLNQDDVKPLLARWVLFDTTPLDTEARRELEEKETEKSLTATYIDESLQNLLEEKVTKKTVVEGDTVDTFETYRLVNNIDGETLDYLVEKVEEKQREKEGNSGDYVDPYKPEKVKPSEYIKDLKVSTWVDKSSYLVRKIAVSFDFKNSNRLPFLGSPLLSEAYSQVLGDSTSADNVTAVALVTKFSDFGKAFPEETPANPMSSEEFYRQLSDLVAKRYGQSFGTSGSQANNAKRRSDVNAILNAISQYQIDNNVETLPKVTTKPQVIASSGVDLCKTLVPRYLPRLPIDPVSGTRNPPESDCTDPGSNYNTGYVISQGSKTKKITVAASFPELGEQISVTR